MSVDPVEKGIVFCITLIIVFCGSNNAPASSSFVANDPLPVMLL